MNEQEDELKVGQNYTVEFLLNFLSDHRKESIFLVTEESIKFNNIHLYKHKYTVYRTETSNLHSINLDDVYIDLPGTKFYYIKPEKE